MRKLLLCLTLVGLLVLAFGGAASAQSPTPTSLATTTAGTNPSLFTPAWAVAGDPVPPTVTAIDPVSAPNDSDTSVTITGTGFATDLTGTILPTVTLGTTPLTGVAFVDATTLTATVPWGMDPGVYALTVTNPDGGTGSLTDAFTATATFTVRTIDPVSGPNDHDTAVTIRGTGFATDATGTIPPWVRLGTTPLTNVTFISVRTLTATVPKGLSPGLYTLSVTNPDHSGGTVSLTDAFTVTPPPTVSAIDPVTAYNDIDEPITITGANFSTDATGTVSPTATLGGAAMLDVAFVDSTTLTAKVPWGMNPGTYDLTVTNPDGGTGGLSGAYTVEQGIGQWNGSQFFGGEVRQILMKPGDPNTLYAMAYGIVGGFRSTDAGDNWTYIPADAGVGDGRLVIDPLHPTWLYCYAWNGLHRSTDEGDTWTTVMPMTWPDGRVIGDGPVYPSPHDAQVLFVGSELGLIKSTDGGTSWNIVADMEGIAVSAVAYDPVDHLQMVLLTGDGRVFHSGDGGDTWSEVAKPPFSNLGRSGSIAYNPYKSSEVWVTSGIPGLPLHGSIYKSTDTALTSWQDVTPTGGNDTTFITFASADSVYIVGNHSDNDGAGWLPFGPPTSSGQIAVDPDNTQIAYAGDDTYGVEKTTDGGLHWVIKSQGLTGMIPSSLRSPEPIRCGSTRRSRARRGSRGTTAVTMAPAAGCPRRL